MEEIEKDFKWNIPQLKHNYENLPDAYLTLEFIEKYIGEVCCS